MISLFKDPTKDYLNLRRLLGLILTPKNNFNKMCILNWPKQTSKDLVTKVSNNIFFMRNMKDFRDFQTTRKVERSNDPTIIHYIRSYMTVKLIT